MDIFRQVKEWLDLVGVKFGVGTGFSLSKFKATPYLKISFHPCAFLDVGPIVTGLSEVGLAAGLKISKSKSKATIWVDAGAVMDGPELFNALQNSLQIPKLGFFAGFRLTL